MLSVQAVSYRQEYKDITIVLVDKEKVGNLNGTESRMKSAGKETGRSRGWNAQKRDGAELRMKSAGKETGRRRGWDWQGKRRDRLDGWNPQENKRHFSKNTLIVVWCGKK